MNKTKNYRGIIMLSTMMVLAVISVLGIGMIFNSQMNLNIAANYDKKIKTFYASDGLITLMAQEALEGRGHKYVNEGTLYAIRSLREDNSEIDETHECPYYLTLHANGEFYADASYPGGAHKFRLILVEDSLYLIFSDSLRNFLEVDGTKLQVSSETDVSYKNIFRVKNGGGKVRAFRSYKTHLHMKTHSNCRIKADEPPSDEDPLELRSGRARFELEPYTPVSKDSVAIGSANVAWHVNEDRLNSFELAVTAILETGGGKYIAKSPLKQYLQLESRGVSVFEPTITIPVTFYDFHSNLTNPEFDQPNGDLEKNMVQSALDSEGKPVLGPNPSLNFYIKYWFRPWSQAESQARGYSIWAEGDYSIPVYLFTVLDRDGEVPQKKIHPFRAWEWDVNGNGVIEHGPPEYEVKEKFGRCGDDHNGYPYRCHSNGQDPSDTVANVTLDTDTSFKNIVIDTSITLQLETTDISKGIYYIDSDAFFPLDDKGFGKEFNSPQNKGCPTCVGTHNFSFTMEIKTKFTMVEGLEFMFSGDDDVWLFLDNKLTIDLGGVHSEASDTVALDTLSHLENGKEYSFDFFYCERRADEAHMRMYTNIFSYKGATSRKRVFSRDYGTLD